MNQRHKLSHLSLTEIFPMKNCERHLHIEKRLTAYNKFQAAVIPVGKDIKVALPFGTSEDREDLSRKIRKISFVGGMGELPAALMLAKKVLEERADDRPVAKAAKMIILHLPDSIGKYFIIQTSFDLNKYFSFP